MPYGLLAAGKEGCEARARKAGAGARSHVLRESAVLSWVAHLRVI